MNPQTFVFIGRSGCGKGTQAKLLSDHLKAKDPARKVYYLQTGQRFRDFIKGVRPTSKLSKEVYDAGERQPDFLAVWIWTSLLVEEFGLDDHLIMDGCPRSLLEAQMIDEAFKFYKREKPCIIYMNVNREWSEEHLRLRGRMDDKSAEAIKVRLDWYDADVAPAVEFFRKDPIVKFIEVNGEQTIEEVYKEIIAKV